MSRLYSIALAPILLAAFAAPAMAQETPATTDVVAVPASSAVEGAIAYAPADFAASRPNTALEMINRLPGFALDSGDQVRGFAGAAGNVLIDGQRPTIKTDSLSDTLARIPIDQVERIDLIRGGGAGIDMQGQTVIANVIRKKVDTFQQVLTLSSFIFGETGHTIPGWNYQATRRSGEHQVEFGLSRGISMDDSVGFGYRTTQDVATGDVLFQEADTEGDGPAHTARATYKGPLAGGTFNANGLVSTDEFKNESHFYSATTDERFINRSANDRGEIGLNYKRPLSAKLELEALTLSKLAQGTFDSTGVTNGDSQLFTIDAEAGETIGRSVLRYAHSPKLSFEGGGEVAFNFREQQNALFTGASPTPVFTSDVRIEELRSEAFVQSTWRPSTKYSFEAGVRVENSKITQSGDTNRERSFVYPKPRFVATWSPTKDDQVRLRIEREVGQLNFQDFASSIDLNSSVLSAGNSDLRPDKTLAYEVAFEKRFWENGAAVLTLRHEDITDVVDLFPFIVFVDDDGDGVFDDADNNGQPDERLVAGPGNIGDGKNDVVEFSLTLPFERLGIKGGELKTDLLFENGEVRDPLTGQTRRISGQRPNNIEVSYRQDLPQHKLTFGATWFAGWSERYFYLEEEQYLELKNYFATFVEYKPTPKFTLRGELNNLDPYRFNI